MDLREQINELYRLHLACIEQDHGIRKRGESWELFIPTKFMYAFFTFNSIFAFNWEQSFKNGKALHWDYFNKVENEDNKADTDPKKIRKLIKLYIETLDVDGIVFFQRTLKSHLPRYIDPVEELEKIVPDPRIKHLIKTFKREFKFIYTEDFTTQPSSMGKIKKSVESLLHFIYMVRCNIFHGTKTVNDIDKYQSRRLQIYIATLIAANELFFEAADKSRIWRKPVNRRPNHGTFKNRFKVDVPEGCLYHPCSGNDTLAPLRLFKDTITEFHFCDIEDIVLPNERANQNNSRNNRGPLPVREVLNHPDIKIDKNTFTDKKLPLENYVQT